MKRVRQCLAAALCGAVLLAAPGPLAAAAVPAEVSIPCQYLVGNTVAETTVQGTAADGNLYVTLDTVAELTGMQYAQASHLLFVSGDTDQGARRGFQLDPAAGTLRQLSAFYQTGAADIPLRDSAQGETLVSLGHMLEAMGVSFSVDAGADIPLSICRPYTIFDARTMLLGHSDFFFDWTEINTGVTWADTAELTQLSAVSALLSDYNSHFVSDVLFASWSDDILDVNEQQYMDTMVEILCAFSDLGPDFTDTLDFQTMVLSGDVFGLTQNTMDLMGISDDMIDLLGGTSQILGTSASILEQISACQTYRQISQAEKTLLGDVFLSGGPESVFQQEELSPIQNAARHLQDLLDDSALGTAAGISDGVAKIGADVVMGLPLPPLVMMDIASMAASLLPGVSQALDSNTAMMFATRCWLLELFARQEFTRLNDQIRAQGPTEALMYGSRQALLFALQASYTARAILTVHPAVPPEAALALRSSNQELLPFIAFLTTCSSQAPVCARDVDWRALDRANPQAAAGITFTRALTADGGAEYGVVTGTDAEGQVLWTYETEHYPLAQLQRVCGLGRTEARYYLCEGGAVVALNAATGAVLWRNEDFAGAPISSEACIIDADGTVYLSGYLGPAFFAVDAQGQTLCRIESFSPDYYWPYQLEQDGAFIAVTLENGPEGYRDDGGYVCRVSLEDFSFTLPTQGAEQDTGQDAVPTLRDNDPLTVSGTLTARSYAINGQNSGSAYILTLDSPIEARLCSDMAGYSGEQVQIGEIQLQLPYDAGALTGTHVVAAGRVMYGHTGHHLTTILLADASLTPG